MQKILLNSSSQPLKYKFTFLFDKPIYDSSESYVLNSTHVETRFGSMSGINFPNIVNTDTTLSIVKESTVATYSCKQDPQYTPTLHDYVNINESF